MEPGSIRLATKSALPKVLLFFAKKIVNIIVNVNKQQKLSYVKERGY